MTDPASIISLKQGNICPFPPAKRRGEMLFLFFSLQIPDESNDIQKMARILLH
jgi:hypothetical protein